MYAFAHKNPSHLFISVANTMKWASEYDFALHTPNCIFISCNVVEMNAIVIISG